jgi:hypothetical protein
MISSSEYIVWRKSSYSGSGSACVEVARPQTGILVRDSKRPDGPAIAFTSAPWRSFLTYLASR